MNDSTVGAAAPFEYTVSEQKTGFLLFKRISLIAVYILWAAILLVAGLLTGQLLVFAVFVPITLCPLIAFSWRRTKVEYEYSFFAGTLTVSRILGGKSRRILTEVALKNLQAVYPCEGDYIERAERFGAKKIVMAASSENAERLCVALWTDENDTKTALYFEPNDRAVRLMHSENYSATSALKSVK